MRKICASVLALTLFAGPALAADTGALPAGQAAGVGAAQNQISTTWVVTGATVLLGLGAYLISTQHDTIATLAFDSNESPLVLDNSTNIIVSTTTSTH